MRRGVCHIDLLWRSGRRCSPSVSTCRQMRFAKSGETCTLYQGGKPVEFKGHSAAAPGPSASAWLRKKFEWGPAHPNFTKFFTYGIAGHGLMFVAMSIGTTQFLQQFTAAGNPITWWLAKDILPALISVASVSFVTPEYHVARWFVIGYGATNLVMLSEFIAPSVIDAGNQPYFGMLSSLARSTTHLVLQVCHASITEQYAQANNFGTMMRSYSNAGTVAFAVCYGLGLLVAHSLSWNTQLAVMAAASCGSVVCAYNATKDFAPQKLSVEVVRLVADDFAALDYDHGKYVAPSPEAFAAKFGHRPVVDVMKRGPLHLGEKVSEVARTAAAFHEDFTHVPALHVWISVHCRDGPCVIFHDEATVTDVLAVMLFADAQLSHSNADAAAALVLALAVDGFVVDQWRRRGKALEERFQAAGWLVSSEGIAPKRSRLRVETGSG
jgi:hypothetical protein